MPKSKDNEQLPKGGFIRLTPLAKIPSLHPQTIRRWWKLGNFPEPKRVYGILLFSNDEVLDWLENTAKNAMATPYQYNNPNVGKKEQ